ncbi:hypothetical protein [Undibacterium pigrum]|uniref:Uncharacterized protein n=1 Tax=Undibacterium pigrum TaxID=401470 RepID=A0A318IXH8_9BURK|nr:hypothetical protein [Undibacterium pigrum]PXX40169.1 hypothetical protein DFR42_1082 [Undibacterium pigrum]
MNKNIKFSVAVTAFGIAQYAQASNMSGAFTIAFGIPIMVVALFIYGILAAAGKLYDWLVIAAIGLFIPLALFGVFMVKDAWSLIGRGDSNFAWGYYLLCILVFLCFLKILKNQNKES